MIETVTPLTRLKMIVDFTRIKILYGFGKRNSCDHPAFGTHYSRGAGAVPN
jgi:hypothetical protein